MAATAAGILRFEIRGREPLRSAAVYRLPAFLGGAAATSLRFITRPSSRCDRANGALVSADGTRKCEMSRYRAGALLSSRERNLLRVEAYVYVCTGARVSKCIYKKRKRGTHSGAEATQNGRHCVERRRPRAAVMRVI